jgi:hypothetical protein
MKTCIILITIVKTITFIFVDRVWYDMIVGDVI